MLTGNAGNNTLAGLGGDDVIGGAAGNDTISGGDGDDSIDGGGGNDAITAGDGSDTVIGGAGADKMDGGDGVDTLDYSGIVTPAIAVIVTLGAANVFTKVTGAGDAAGDTIANFENVIGDAGNDSLTGNADDNTLSGGAGNDKLAGNDGNDVLTGGAGNDTLTGGNDSDRFVYSAGDGRDTVTDFAPGVDQIDLASFGFANFSTDVQPHLSQVGTDVVLDLHDGGHPNDVITLKNATVGALSAGDVLLS